MSKRRPRLVQFDLEANQVQETERVYQDSKESFFWTTLERDGIQETNQRLALQFRRQQPQSAEKVNLVLDLCFQDHGSDDSSSEEDEEPSYVNDNDEHDEREIQDTLAATGTLALEVPTHVRGLEWSFLPGSKKYRQTHMKRVLRWQKCLGRNQSMLLSSRAIRSSRPSRVLARILGACDEIKSKENPVTQRNRCRMLPSWW
jgi:hypothetical protein